MPDDNVLYAPVPTDPRVRAKVGDYRCVAPDAKAKGNRVFLNGALIIEKRQKDSLGADIWVEVGVINKPAWPYGENTYDVPRSLLEANQMRERQNREFEEAIYYLLGNSCD